jgi:hypothetical protein
MTRQADHDQVVLRRVLEERGQLPADVGRIWKAILVFASGLRRQ